MKSFTRIIALALVVAVVGTFVFAATASAQGPNGIHTPGTGLVDGTPRGPQGGRLGNAYGPADGSGPLGGQAFGYRNGGLGQNFVDADGDGICDYYESR